MLTWNRCGDAKRSAATVIKSCFALLISGLSSKRFHASRSKL
jgi:hypothetical protein